MIEGQEPLIFDHNVLERALEELPRRNRVAFAASCCERLLPNYHAFTLVESWGDLAPLVDGIDLVWHYLATGTLPEPHARKLALACEAAAPDMEDFGSLYAPAALDAAASVAYTLEGCLTDDVRPIADVASLARETIYLYLHRIGQPTPLEPQAGAFIEDWVQHSPLMQQELAKQQQDLLDLQQRTLLTPEFLLSLRTSSQGLGLQPFLRGIMQDPGRVTERRRERKS
jgi:uncharacterized protein YjaG (DUF416 family)